MIQLVDSVAFKFLFLLYGILGIQDVPEHTSNDWIITKRWEELPDQTYKLEMISNEIGDQCARNEFGFIVFPQTYMGQMKIFSDGKIIYTNSMSSVWNITQLMSKPLYSCQIFKNSKEVRLEILAYMQFFTSVSGYPEYTKEFPSKYIFYDEVFVISSVISLFLGLIGAILMAKFTNLVEVCLYFMQQVGFCLLVVSHIPGRYYDISLACSHTIVIIGGFIGLFALILNTVTIQKDKMKIFILLISMVTVPAIIFHGYKNATHLLILLLIVSSFFSCAYLAIYKLNRVSRLKDYLITSLYLLLLILIVFDGVGSQIKRESFLYLSSIALVGSCISFLTVLKGFNGQQKELIVTSARLKSELKVIDSVTSLNNSYKEIIHDIKSPVMSMGFLLLDIDRNKMLLVGIAERIKSILNRVENFKLEKMADWYSVNTLISKIIDVVEEKKTVYSHLKVAINNNIRATVEIFYDPIDANIIFEEVLDNAIKHSNGELNIRIDLTDKFLRFECTNSIHSRNNIELTKIGLGVGLINLKKKMLDVGGELEVIQELNNFILILKFETRRT